MSYSSQVQLDSDEFMIGVHARVKVGLDTWVPRLPPAANLDEVLRDQFELLIDSRENIGASDSERSRLNRISAILLEPFEEPELIFAFAAVHHEAVPVI